MLDFFKTLFDIKEQKKQLLAIILICFFASFFIVRIYSLIVGNSIYIRGYQIHHFYFGMLLLSLGGVLGILSKEPTPLRMSSVLVGTGLGLFADEIGLLLNCTTHSHACLYAFPDSFDIVGSIGVGIVFLIVLAHAYDRFSEHKNLKK